MDVESELLLSDIDTNENIPERRSQDDKCNGHGYKFLDLLKATGLRVINGRLFSDKGLGKFTCINKQGSSVVDYVCCECATFEIFNSFCVRDLTQFSDHTPVTFSIRVPLSLDDNTQNDILFEYSKWKEDFMTILKEV